MLYEVVVIKRQTVKEKENEEPEKILDPLQMIVARDREAAKFKAIIMGGYEIDEVEVIVLRFEGN